jgi:hypothetical protein
MVMEVSGIVAPSKSTVPHGQLSAMNRRGVGEASLLIPVWVIRVDFDMSTVGRLMLRKQRRSPPGPSSSYGRRAGILPSASRALVDQFIDMTIGHVVILSTAAHGNPINEASATSGRHIWNERKRRISRRSF